MRDDRSLDDLPLAAYSGGLELPPEDEPSSDFAPPPSEVVEPADVVPPGAFAHALPQDAQPEHAIPDDNFGAGKQNAPRSLPPAAVKVLTTLRTSRGAAGAAFAGVIVVGLLLLAGGGPKPDAAGANASASTLPAVVATREPGNATLVLTGAVEQTVTFTASSGAGAPGTALATTWTDPTANSLALTGAVDRGTRSTNETLVLQWTVMVEEEPITFTSTEGECTLGMAVNTTNVSGTFACRKLTSDDGKYVVGATGTYRT